MNHATFDDLCIHYGRARRDDDPPDSPTTPSLGAEQGGCADGADGADGEQAPRRPTRRGRSAGNILSGGFAMLAQTELAESVHSEPT